MAFIPVLRNGYLFYDELRTYGEDFESTNGNLKQDRIAWRDEVISNQERDFGDATSGAYASVFGAAKVEEIRNFLLTQAQAERGRELAVLQQFFGLDTSGLSGDILDEDFNAVVIQFYNNYLSHMPAVKNLIQQIKMDKDTKSRKSEGHMTAATLFGDYFNPVVDEKWKTFRDGQGMASITRFENGELYVDEGSTKQVIEEFYSECQMEQLSRLSKSVTNEGTPQEVKLYEDLAKLIPILNDRSNPLANAFMRSLGMDSFSERLMASIKKAQKKNPNRKFSQTDYKRIMKSRLHVSQSQRGLIAEELNNVFIRDVLEPLTRENPNLKVAAYRVGGNRSKIDAVVGLFKQEWIAGVDEEEFNKLLDMISDIGANGASDELMQQDIERVYARMQTLGLDNSALILRTDKNYVLGKHLQAEGFRGTSFNYDRMLGLLNQLGLFGSETTDTAIAAYMNTAPGALFDNHMELQEAFRTSLSRIFQEAMFDDVATIAGNNQAPTANIIHVFNLSGVTVPLSYMLQSAARALDAATQSLYMSMEVRAELPKEEDFLFRNGDTKGIDMAPMRWEKQAEKAHSATTFTIYFGKEFVDVLAGDFSRWL